MILAKKVLKWTIAGFAVLCLLVYLFTRPAAFGDLIGKLLGGVFHAADAVVTVVERISRG